MATPQNSGNTPARPNDTQPIDPTLEAAIAEAAAHPERAAKLAQELGLSHGDKKQYSTSALGQVLRGESFPPPIHDIYWDEPPAGAFDGGVTRVMGESELYFLTKNSLCAAGTPWVTSETDRVGSIRQQVINSYGFARYAGVLMVAIEEAQGNDKIDGVEYTLSEMIAVAFLAGWYMAMEHSEVKQNAREEDARVARGTIPELLDLFGRKLHPGSVSDDALTSKCHWTPAQVDAAREIVRQDIDGGTR